MNDMSANGTELAGQRDFGDGISESVFGQDPGADGRTLRGQASSLRDQASDKLRSFADMGKDQVTASLDGLIDAARDIAGKIGGQGGPLGGYAHTAVDTLEGWAAVVKDKSIEDLIDDGRDFARRSPAAAVGIAVLTGFALSRFLKASSGHAA